MTSASIDIKNSFDEIDVWLEVGRDGRLFTYKDSLQLGIESGDIVLVRLRGRPMHGLVVARRKHSRKTNFKADKLGQKIVFSAVEGLVQKSAVDPQWQEWLEQVAINYYISPFRMLKTALPPGWLGHRTSNGFGRKKCWWLNLEDCNERLLNLSPRQSELVDALIAKGGGAWQRDLHSQGFSASVINRLIEIGRASREKRDFNSEQKDSRNIDNTFELEKGKALTDEQELAIDIYQSLPFGNALLLWGVTGSGKTEVYLQIAEREISEGKSCLILTPEIGLIPQLVDRFRRRFGDQVMEYHSGCSERERASTWRGILSSLLPLVVVGTRSAIFLPLSPLGVIVLDEEHDSSYKQDSPMPCYHARDLALDRASRTGARVILGSATPSLLTWKSLRPDGPIALAKLKNRISKKPLPSVYIVDMRQELAEGHRRLISRPLMNLLKELPDKKEQAVVLVPRRGYSSFLSCRSCGAVVQCPNCDVALTVHKGKDGNQWLSCHWCNYRANLESSCSECGSFAFKPFGAGTQRVMEHLMSELEELRLLRFDRDTTGGREGHRKLLEQFASGDADVLIGTQMLAKGMDLPNVTLAVVLAADGLLHRPDLFATEQTLQLFMQLAGRAGRGELPGKVIVQTYCPDHPVILHLIDGRYELFLEKEIELRRGAGLAPFSRACLLRLSGESATTTATASAALAAKIKSNCLSNGWFLMGPAPALIARVAGKSRWQLLIHGPEGSQIPLPYGPELWDGLPKGVNLSIDPDPLQL